MKITKPGVYPDLKPEDYHAQHDWLSNSGAKLLLKPSCPAKFKAAQTKDEEHKRHFDLGKVVHTLTLGEGDEFVVVQAATRALKDTPSVAYDARNYDTKAAQDHRDAIYAAGQVPILRHELVQAVAMSESVKKHRLAGPLLTDGAPEVSLFWVDEATGVKCRARLDWCPNPQDGKRMLVPDLKSAVSSEPDEFSRNAARFGYARQDRWYRDAVIACGLDSDPAFLFIIVEKEDPYIVTVGQFTQPDDLRLAAAMNDRARRIFRECTEADAWPDYVDGIADLALPTWHHYQNEEYLSA